MADVETVLIITGEGEVIDPDEDVAAIGSGGPYALSAATALLRHTKMDASEIARKAMDIAATLCIYTNHEISLESTGPRPEKDESDASSA